MRYPMIRFGLFMLVIMSLVVVLPVSASSVGNGIIVEGNPAGTDNIGSLNPLLCNNPYCRRITNFLFPTLYAVDPSSGLLIAAADGNFGLGLDTAAPTEKVGTIKLRDDLIWSDGVPVTAYDVFYSYLAIRSRFVSTPFTSVRSMINEARVVDEHTIEFAFDVVNCSLPSQINFPIVPAHVFDPQFREIVDELGTGGDLEDWFTEWLAFYKPSRFNVMNSNSFNANPNVTAGAFQFVGRLPGEEIRLVSPDGALAFVYRDISSGMNAAQFFNSGSGNVLVNPNMEMRDDLIADLDNQIIETVGNTWNYIGLNVANPNLSRSAFDGNGKLLEQGHHPIFGDVRMRQAIQKGINVNQLIDTALLGYGMPIASGRIPGTWAANDALQPTAFDPEGAKRLLDAAGWRDHNNDRIRECDGCLYASEGASLYFNLMVAFGGGREIAADLIAEQLSRVGIGVNVNVMDAESLLDQVRFQQFDAYLYEQRQDFPADADQSDLFTRSGDVLYGGNNYGSYFNPQIEDLMSQALTLPGCDPNVRSDMYRDIHEILEEDQPFIWLYAPSDMLVTRGIIGVSPYPNRPFWNIRDWIVTS